MKLAVVSNVNMQPLSLHLKKRGFKAPYFCSYGQHVLELLDTSSGLYASDLNVLFVHLDTEELLKDQAYVLPDATAEPAYLKDLLEALRRFCDRRPEVTVIVSQGVLPPFSFLSYLEGNSKDSFTQMDARITQDFTGIAEGRRNVFFLDFKRLIQWHGYSAFFDEKYWYLGRIKYSELGFKSLAEDLQNLLRAIHGMAKKVLVLDLDNTLWGGVLGEDGPAGIRLSEDGVGKSYRDFQKCIKALKSTGILLAICSKNNEDDVRELFDRSSMMVLKYSDFASRRINWNNKAENLQQIAEELNLGTDSLVFIDDSPTERALVRQFLPDVTVPDFPIDLAQLKSWFLRQIVYQHFPRIRLTDEDLKKSEQYDRNSRRNDLSRGLDLKDFIASLDIKIKVRKNASDVLPRVAQLTQKTNQFNLTTRRYTEAEIEKFLGEERNAVYSLEYEDRFGPEGIIGVCMIESMGQSANVVNFLQSCRVLGRNVEFMFFYEVVMDLRENGFKCISAEYIPSVKNVVSKDFYSNCGMVLQQGRYENDVCDLIATLSNVVSEAQNVAQ